MLEIFEESDADYGLYSIISIEKIDNPNPGGIAYSYISIDVKLERTGNGDSADSRARFKVFKAPEGGDASAFVKKSGDNMEGTLDMQGASGRNKIINLPTPTSDYHAANKEYVDKVGVGSSISAGRTFQGALPNSGYPTSYNNFVTNSGYPAYVNQIYLHPDPPNTCLLYTSPSPRDRQKSRMPSSA